MNILLWLYLTTWATVIAVSIGVAIKASLLGVAFCFTLFAIPTFTAWIDLTYAILTEGS